MIQGNLGVDARNIPPAPGGMNPPIAYSWILQGQTRFKKARSNIERY